MEHTAIKSGRRRFQFSLRTLLLITTLIAVLLAGYTSDWWQGLSSTDYRILSAALTPYLTEQAPSYNILAKETLATTRKSYQPFFDFNEAPSLIPELQQETIQDFLRKNERAYPIRRRPAADLPYELEPSDEAAVQRLIQSRGEPSYDVDVSCPGIDRQGKQAVVLVKKQGRVITHLRSGELVILSNENGSWHVTKTVDIDKIRETDEYRKRKLLALEK